MGPSRSGFHPLKATCLGSAAGIVGILLHLHRTCCDFAWAPTGFLSIKSSGKRIQCISKFVDLRIEWLWTFCSGCTSQPIYPSCASQDGYDLKLLFQKRELASWNRVLGCPGRSWDSWSRHISILTEGLWMILPVSVPWRCWCWFVAVAWSVVVVSLANSTTLTSIFT